MADPKTEDRILYVPASPNVGAADPDGHPDDAKAAVKDQARADDLAAKYDLKPETSDLMGTSSKGYARELSQDLQPPEGLAGPGKVSIVAREGDALGGKTLLACEFAPD